MKRLLEILLGLFLFVFLTGAATYNIDPNNDGSQYCWSENAGWVNFQPATDGVFVSSTSVSGKAWGENIGWVNLSPVNGGVVNDGYGNLSGYAWGENVGWINFAPTGGGIKIDLNGNFTGKAWGENIGWINCNPATGGGVKTSWLPPDNDGDGYIADMDCNDNDPNVHPGAFEACNGLDDNCNGQVDENLPIALFYRDADADGYGNPAAAILACSQLAGFVTNNTDCNDSNTTVNPGAAEVCNGVDDNCNGQTDESGASVIAGPTINPSNGHTYYAIANNTWTGAEAQAQLLGGHLVSINNNAENSWVWETFAPLVGGRLWIGLNDVAQEGTFVWASGEPAAYFNWWCRSQTDCEPSNSGGVENYVELNNYVWNDNVNGQYLIGIVEASAGTRNTYYRDADSDGYGNLAITTQACSAPAGYVANNTDCNDSDANISPGGPPARTTGTTIAYYSMLQSAYNAAEEGATIQVKDVSLNETLGLNLNKTVKIEAGYDCGYSTVTGKTTINGSITNSAGKVIIQAGTLEVK